MVVKTATDISEQASATSPKRGGLVSMRVEMYERPLRDVNTKRGYRSRPQDSFDSPPRRAESRQNCGGSDTEDLPSSPTYVGSTLIESGVTHYARGEYEKALKAFNTALKTQRVSIGDEDICIALTLSNLGSVYLRLGELEKAEQMLLDSLLMKRRVKPRMNVADSLNNLGNCSNLRGDREKSLEYYAAALEELRSKNGKPEDVADTLFNIGRLHIQLRDWEPARSTLTEAWRISRDIYGPNHAFVAQTLDLIGLVQLTTGDVDSSMISFTKALGIFRRLHGPLHLDVAGSLFNVGMVREARGELADAWESYTTTRDLYSRLGTDSDDPRFKILRQSISNVERKITQENQERQEVEKQAQEESAAASSSTPKTKKETQQQKLLLKHKQARKAVKSNRKKEKMKKLTI